MIYVVKGRETVTGLSASKGFTAIQIPPTTTKLNVIYAIAQPVDGDIRMCMDGTVPTSTRGIKINEDTIFEVWGSAALIAFRCINDGGTAKLEVIYMGQGG